MGDSVTEKSSLPSEIKDIETMERVMDTDSVDSEKLVSESTAHDVPLKVTDNNSGSPCSKQRSLIDSKDTSFTLDAAGNGDVAEAMGKTLDMVAGVISEMLCESEGSDKPYESGSESKQGELILNPSDDVEKVDEEEGDADWSVVKSIGSNGTTESEQIGKATEMLGTAHSITAGKNSDHRWVKELEKLRELGFDSDSICIEILERICSDSCTVETNIDRVVDELLSFNS